MDLKTFQGFGVNRNHAFGRAFKYNYNDQPIEQKNSTVQVFLDTFETVRNQAITEINQLYLDSLKDGLEEADIFLAHMYLLQSDTLINNVTDDINAGKDLITALRNSMDKAVQIFCDMESEIFCSKTCDVVDVFNRMIEIAAKIRTEIITPEEDFILCCDNLLPSYLYKFDNKHLKGIVVKNATSSSHGVLLAKSKNIPLVINVPEYEQIEDNDRILISGSTGKIVFLNKN